MDCDEVYIVKLFCPNCGSKISGKRCSDNYVKGVCKKCGAMISSKAKNGSGLYLNLKVVKKT